jgi:hypothetical protein
MSCSTHPCKTLRRGALRRGALGLSAACLALLAGDASLAAPKQPLRVQLPARAGVAVRRAVLSVKRRLDDEACRLVFSDFRSTHAGRPLADVLGERGQSAAAHLDTLVFKDGSGKRACASGRILAFTYVGADTVYVCASQFTHAVENDPGAADVVLIHEVLHTLGLGENPPTSGQISARVAERCGDRRARVASTAR